jgi:geranylgeranylglycerol-phosphate geranylgeranyltransferase
MRAFLRAVKEKALAYLEMARPYTLFHAGTLALASGLVASEGRLSVWRAALIWLTPTVGWLAGLVTSDYHDRELDRIEKPHRPIPSGRVGEREGFWLMVGTIAAGFVGALALGWRTFLLAWLVMALGIGYARALKARGFLGHFDRGVLASLTVAFGSIAATGGVPRLVWPLIALFFCHDSATNLLGAVRDIEGDRAAGYRAVPLSLLRLGAAVAFDALALGQTLSAAAQPIGTVGGRSARRTAALGAHKVLVLERLVLSVAFIATVTPPWVALPLLAALASVTWWAQTRLRDRYEFAPGGSAGPAVPPGGLGTPVAKEESRGPAGTPARTA